MKFKKIANISIAFRLLALLKFGSTGNAISLNVTSALVSSLILFCVKAHMCLLCWHVVYLCVKSSFCPGHSWQSGESTRPSLFAAYVITILRNVFYNKKKAGHLLKLWSWSSLLKRPSSRADKLQTRFQKPCRIWKHVISSIFELSLLDGNGNLEKTVFLCWLVLL
jgi:hypothetical protein